MALFDPAFDFMLPHEGSAYTCDPSDPGGETKYGISKESFPSCDIANLTLDEAKAIYRRNFWDREHFAEIQSQAVANKIFDLSVNQGTKQAVMLLQRACGDCGAPVTADGCCGPLTVAIVNGLDPEQLLTALRARAVSYYRQLVQQHPSLQKFQNGWLKRAQA